MLTKDIVFPPSRKFAAPNFDFLNKLIGLYFIFLPERKISYPFRDSRLIYIGMSEKKTNSIGKRLLNHITGGSGNKGITNYNKKDGLLFTYFGYDMYKDTWPGKVEALENYFILDFQEKFGVYPICNNKSSDIEVIGVDDVKYKIDWSFFD